MRDRRGLWLRLGAHVGALVPLVVLGLAAWGQRLGPDPIGESIRRSGRTALWLLLLSLMPGAARVVLGLAHLRPLRRILGLYAFLYAILHAGLILGVDYAWDWAVFVAGLSAPFPLAGLAAWLLLLPLGPTSTRGWQQRLGPWWPRLHRLVYPAAALSVVHFIWAAKELRPDRLLYGVVLLLLLLLRLWPVAGRWAGRRAH